MNETAKNNAFEKLTPERKALAERVLENLKNCDGLWQQGWIDDNVASKELVTQDDITALKVVTTAGVTGKTQIIYVASKTINELNKEVKEVSFTIYTEQAVKVIVCFKYAGSNEPRAMQTIELKAGANEIKLTNFASVNWTKEKYIENISFRLGDKGAGNQTIYFTDWTIVGGGKK